MSRFEGVNMFASGDCVLDDRQMYLFNSIERLQAHMVTLKDKLQQEKMLLSELKAETLQLTEQHGRTSQQPHVPHRSSDIRVGANPYSSVQHAGDMGNWRRPDSPKGNLDRLEYVQKLTEIDNLCKEEMARVNSVVERMEPLKQIASDWSLETRLNEMSAEPVLAKEINAILEGDAVEQYLTQSGSEPIGCRSSLRHFNCNSDLIALPTGQDRTNTMTRPIFIPDGLCASKDTKKDSSPEEEAPLHSELRPDSTVKQVSQTPHSALSQQEDPTVVEQKRPEPSSDWSLTSLKVFNDTNMPEPNKLAYNISEEGTSTINEKKSATSVLTAKSAISLASIKHAFSKCKQGNKLQCTQSDNRPGAKNISDLTEKTGCKENKNSIKNVRANNRLRSTVKKIIKNWGIVEENGKAKNSGLVDGDEDLFGNGDFLCEDDVVNNYLYCDGDYVYSPLFASENEGANSS